MDKQIFELKDAHVKLLSAAYISWDDCEFGAPAIDPKRPYGNGCVETDIGVILGTEPDSVDDWGDEVYSQATKDKFVRLHRETKTALQVILATKSFNTGVYEADKYCKNWTAKETPNED